MIMSGWILPDLYEVKCLSYSNSSSHTRIIKRYLENLKSKDITIYTKIEQTLESIKKDYPYISLDDFAVQYLGWIKINDSPIRIVFFAENHNLETLVQKYTDFGYTLIPIKSAYTFIQVNIPSSKII